MKPTCTSDQARVTPRNSNQKSRKLRMSNQLSVLLPLVNEADTYPSNLTIVGEIEGNPVHLMVDTGARVPAIKEEVLRENFGGAPYSVVQTATTTKKNFVYPAFIP